MANQSYFPVDNFVNILKGILCNSSVHQVQSRLKSTILEKIENLEQKEAGKGQFLVWTGFLIGLP